MSEYCQNAIAASKHSRQRMLAIVHRLEAAQARATPRREDQWCREVMQVLQLLEDAIQAQSSELHAATGLMADLIADSPRLSRRVDRLRATHDELTERTRDLCQQINAGQRSGTAPVVARIRNRVESLLQHLRQFQSQETDLIYEAVGVDIGFAD